MPAGYRTVLLIRLKPWRLRAQQMSIPVGGQCGSWKGISISPWMQRPGDWGTCTGKRWLSRNCLQRSLSFHFTAYISLCWYWACVTDLQMKSSVILLSSCFPSGFADLPNTCIVTTSFPKPWRGVWRFRDITFICLLQHFPWWKWNRRHRTSYWSTLAYYLLPYSDSTC